MDQRNDADTRLCIKKEVDDCLVSAAKKIWRRARLVVIRYLSDDFDAAEIVEAAVYAALPKRHSIRNLEAYLLKSVVRESIHRRQQNQRLQYLERATLERIAPSVSVDLDRALDGAKLIELLRACMDERCRYMYDLRVLHWEWRSIAELIGYSSAHTAEVQFDKRMDRALERFRAKHPNIMKRPQGRKADE